ncbi:MAG TPA: sialidase family protein [Vicinamibacterales bacterium]|nr:sialidase family protein [Vicinamibacterales bacterium]
MTGRFTLSGALLLLLASSGAPGAPARHAGTGPTASSGAAAPVGFAAVASPSPIPSPAAAPSAQPQLAVASDGSILLSWLEDAGSGRHRFRFARRLRDGWSDPVLVHEGDRFFANWADVPAVFPAPDGTLFAHWLEKSGPETYAYDVKVRVSADGGGTWSSPITLHRDRTRTEHGFVSWFPVPGGAGAIWLDGRDLVAGDGEHAPRGRMSLRATMLRGATPQAEALVDPQVCECCPTAAAATSRGAIVAYRDRSDEEIRDIAVARFEQGRWSRPVVAHADNWRIPGCPVNGPALAARGDRVALAWFTAADGARVNVAFSSDGGATFGPPVRVDDGDPLGRVDVELLSDGSALVGWIERLAPGAAFRVRRVAADGGRDEAITVAPVSPGRSSGYPRLAVGGEEILFAWVADGRVNIAAAAPGRPSRTAPPGSPARAGRSAADRPPRLAPRKPGSRDTRPPG